ncbi:MAG: hypothetical protein KHY89_08750 [Butyricicoccus pullicaecorum]|nr:hypothetical protein [Butyricicoccus pullicaecorum]
MDTNKQKQILACMNDVLGQNGFRAELIQQTENTPLMLRAETQRLGKIAKEVIVEACFIPIALPDENNGLLQFFVTLFQNVPEQNAAQTERACKYCNDFSALGNFGFFAPAGQIYLKHNTLLDAGLELEKVITFVADNISLLVASATRFIDAFAAIGFSGLPVDAAIDQELLPKM